MKKFVFFIAALLIVTVFNFNSEANAAYQREHKLQNTSAYTGSQTGHGATYGYSNSQYNTVAVRKKVGTTVPLIPFGTNLSLYNSLYLNGPNINKSQFMVTDTGSGTGLSSYWIDIYYGSTNTTNTTNANKFGNTKIVSYSAYY